MKRSINIGNTVIPVTASGVDETLEKMNVLIDKLKEANDLIDQLASKKVSIQFGDFENFTGD